MRYVTADGSDGIVREFHASTAHETVPRIVAEAGPENWPAVLQLGGALRDGYDDGPTFDGDSVRVNALYEEVQG